MTTIRNIMIGTLMMALIMVSFSFLLNTNNVDPNNVYNTSELHSEEPNFRELQDSLIAPGTKINESTSDLQTQLYSENQGGSDTGVGSSTISTLKFIISFDWVGSITNMIGVVGGEIGVPAEILRFAIMAILIFVIFLVVSALMRWAT